MKVYSFLVARDLLRARKMAQWVKVHAVQTWQPELESLDPMAEGEKQSLELVLRLPHTHHGACAHIHICTYVHVHTYTHILFLNIFLKEANLEPA